MIKFIENYGEIKHFKEIFILEQKLLDLKKLIPDTKFILFQSRLLGTIQNYGIITHNQNNFSKTKINLPVTMTIILSWLSIFGLVIPLSYLSSQLDCSKFWLLFSFSIGIAGLIVYLIIEIRKIYILGRPSR